MFRNVALMEQMLYQPLHLKSDGLPNKITHATRYMTCHDGLNLGS